VNEEDPERDRATRRRKVYSKLTQRTRTPSVTALGGDNDGAGGWERFMKKS